MTRVAPSRIAGLSGFTRRSPPSPNHSGRPSQVSRTGGKTMGIAADAQMWSIPISTGSVTRRLLSHSGCPRRPWMNVNERPE